MKKIRVQVREVSFLTYEIEVEDNFDTFDDFGEIAELLYGPEGFAPDPIETEVNDEEITDAWEVACTSTKRN